MTRKVKRSKVKSNFKMKSFLQGKTYLKIVQCIGIAITVMSCNSLADKTDHVEVQQNFRHIGYVATSLSWGHIHSTLKFNKLKTAVKGIVRILHARQASNSTSSQEKSYIKLIEPQLTIASDYLEDLQELFFGSNNLKMSTKQKRQVFLGIAIALGLFSAGTSIYNTIEIKKLHMDIISMKSTMIDGFRHVATILQEEDHSIHQLTNNVHILKGEIRYLLDSMYNVQDDMRNMQNVILVGAIAANLNAQLSAWGRGLEGLSQGILHPSLVSKSAMKTAFLQIKENAEKVGLKTLHKDFQSVFKNPISYLATEDEEIVVMIHVPLVEQKPMELLEYLPIPIQIGEIFMTLEGQKTLLATDLYGQQGLEMSDSELVKCSTEDLYNGKLYICPNSNLLVNRIRNSCLGAIYYGHQREALKHCYQHVQLPKEHDEFIKQISEKMVALYTRENLTVRRSCNGKVELLPNITGLTTIAVPSGCKLVTENYTFKSSLIIDMESDFIQKIMKIPHARFFNKTSMEQVTLHLKKLNQIKDPEKIHLDTLNQWIQEEEAKSFTHAFSLASILVALLGVAIVLVILVLLYLRYRKARAESQPEKSEK